MKKIMSLIDKFPQIKIPNKFFLNTGNFVFSDMAEKIKMPRPLTPMVPYMQTWIMMETSI